MDMPSLEQDETQSASTSDLQSPIPEPDEVYYMFGGAAIAEFL